MKNNLEQGGVILRCVACAAKYESNGKRSESNFCPKCREIAKEELSMWCAMANVGDALDELGASVLHAIEPILEPIVNKLNKIFGGWK